MATFATITTYRDPSKLDIGVLGKATMYKQQNYDANVAAMQQMINEYANTDLLRDIDKEYMGTRLNHLVENVNTLGAVDWSRKSLFKNYTNYVSQVLDNNVIAAIGSTQLYRKHKADMEELKKKKPELYSIQNDWAASNDIERYMTSGKIGDMYQQGTYVPYTDITKEILKNAPLLKDFGVEVFFKDGDSNPYFRTINKHEVLSKEKVRSFMDLVLGEKGNQQLMIDGMYKYRNVSTEDLEKGFNESLKATMGGYDNVIKTMKEKLKGLGNADHRKILEENIASLEKGKESMSATLNSTKDRNGMIYNMYVNDFKEKWASTLSFDRITDYKIDDSGFKLHKFRHEQSMDMADLQLKQARLELDYDKFEMSAASKGMIKNPNTGKWEKDPNAVTDDKGNLVSSNGIHISQEDVALGEESHTGLTDSIKEVDDANVFLSKKAHEIAKKTGQNAATVRKELVSMANGNISGNAGLRSHISDEDLDKIREGVVDKHNVLKGNINSITQHSINVIDKEFDNFKNGKIKGEDVANRQFKSGNMIIDDNGNLVKGSAADLQKTAKTNRNAKLWYQLGMINNLIHEKGDTMSPQTVAAYRRKQLLLINSQNNLTTKQKEALATQMVKGAKVSVSYDKGEGQGSATSTYYKLQDNTVNSFFRKKANDDFYKTGDAANDMTKRLLPTLSGKTANTKITVNMKSDTGKSLIPMLQANMPQNISISKDGSVQLTRNEDGSYKATVSTGSGKTASTYTIPMLPSAELPQNLRDKIDTTNYNYTYSAKNPNAPTRDIPIDMVTNRDSFNESLKGLSPEEQVRRIQNAPVTIEDIQGQMKMVFGNNPEVLNTTKRILNGLSREYVRMDDGKTWGIAVKSDGAVIGVIPTGNEYQNNKISDVKMLNDLAVEKALEYITSVYTTKMMYEQQNRL